MEELLILAVALAQDDQLEREFHHIMEHLTNQVQALVGHQAADDAHDGHVGLFPQPQQPLQLRLAHVLAAHVVLGVVPGDMRVGSGVVAGHIDAVEHAGELVAALAHDAVQPVGKVCHLQLVGVGGGDGVDRIGAQDGALEQVHVPVHEDGAVVRPAVVQAEQVAQGVLAVAALVLDVVDGQRGADAAEAVLPHAVVLEVDGHQRRLPVVAVDHLRPEAQVGQHAHHGPGEEAEALSVIHVAVEVGTVEILLVVQEVPGHAVLLHGEKAAVVVPPGKVHIVIAKIGQLIAEALFHPLVQRQDHRHLGTFGCQSRRQGAGHVCKTAGFTKRNSLAGCIQNLHIFSPFLFPFQNKGRGAPSPVPPRRRLSGRGIRRSREKGGTASPLFIQFKPRCPWPARWDRWHDP